MQAFGVVAARRRSESRHAYGLDIDDKRRLRPYLNTSASNLDPLPLLTQHDNIQFLPLFTHALPKPYFGQLHKSNLARGDDLQLAFPIRPGIEWRHMNRFRALPNEILRGVYGYSQLGGCS